MNDGTSIAPPPASPRNPGPRRIALGLGILALVIAAGVALYFSPVRNWVLSRFAPQAEQIVTLRSADGVSRYSVKGTILTALAPVKADTKSTFYIKESATPLPSGTPVLGSGAAEGPSRNAMLLTADNRLLPIALGSMLSSLTSGTNGMVSFEMRSGPVNAPEAPHVWVANPPGGAPKDLGEGEAPAFAPDQKVLAFAPAGLIQLDPVTGTRTVLLAAPYASSTGLSLIAPSAAFAVLPNGVTHAADVYAINPLHTVSLSYVGSLPAVPTVLGALDASSFLAGPDSTHLTRYAVSATAVTAEKGTYVTR